MAFFRQAERWYQTTRHLSSGQVYHRARLRVRKRLSGRIRASAERRYPGAGPVHTLPARTLERSLHTPEEAELFANGALDLLGERRTWPHGHPWLDTSILQLRRYHLHYFDWVWGFVNHPDRDWAQAATAKLIVDWSHSVPYGHWIPWHPYVVACRVWNLCAAAADLGLNEEERHKMLWLHGDYLRRHMEYDVGGNHLLRDARGLLAAGFVLREQEWFQLAIGTLERELERQVLPDGCHFERSAFYHAQVLADLMEVREVLTAGDRSSAVIDAAVASMHRWLSMVRPSAETLPQFHDGARTYRRLESTALSRVPVYGDHRSGYLVARNADAFVIMDAGRPCPPELPAHAHSCLLSVEIFHRGEPVLVNSGTSTYDEPWERGIERATAAHNTIRIDGEEQSDAWSCFRMGRRANPVHVAWGGDARTVLEADHDGYERLGFIHRRTVELRRHETTVHDTIRPVKRRPRVALVELSWHFAPDLAPGQLAPGIYVTDHVRVEVHGSVPLTFVLEETWYSPAFGVRVPKTTLRCCAPITGETRFTTKVTMG